MRINQEHLENCWHKINTQFFYLPFLFLLEGDWSIGVSIEGEGKQTVNS